MEKIGTMFLIKTEYTLDAYGVKRKTETKRKLRCAISSVYGYESSDARVRGIKAEKRLIIRATEYHDEEVLEYKDVRYSIYRTFLRDDERIELYVQRDVGA